MTGYERVRQQRDAARATAVALEQENADLLERISNARVIVRNNLEERCYHAAAMEYYGDPCDRCLLLSELEVPA